MSRALLLSLNCLLPVLLLCGLLSCLLCRSFLGCFLRRCLLGNCLLCNCLLCNCLLGNCLLGGGFLCCFLNCQLYTSFSGFADALFDHCLLGLGLSALGASVALLCGGLLWGLLGHNFFLGCFLCRSLLGSLLYRNLFSSLLCRSLLRRSLLRWSFLLRGLLRRRLCYRCHNHDQGLFAG